MKKFTLIAAALFLTGAAFAQKTGEITLNKGQKFKVATDIRTHSVTSMMGQEMENKTDIHAASSLAVDAVTGNTYKLVNTVTGMKINTSMMGQELSYDTDAPDESSPLAGMKEMLNKPQTITIDKSGKVLSTTFEDAGSSPIMQQLEASGAGSKSALLAVPANMKAGDSFSTTDSDSATGTTTAIKYTVKSLNGDNATLTYTGTVKTDGKMENQGMEIHTQTEGTVEGETVVNRKTGIVQTSKSKTKSSGTVSVMGQEMPISVDAEADVTVTEVK